jgi:drug/metabolite transporter (DMT)-like permease
MRSEAATTIPRERLPVRGLVQLALSVVLLASAWPVTKSAIEDGAQPLWFAAGRAGASCLVAAAVLIATGRVRRPARRDMPAILAVGLLQLALFFALAHIAVAYVSAGRTTILANVTTIWIAPLSYLLLRERVSPRRWLAAIIGLAGVVVLMGPWAIDWHAPGVLVGHFLLLLAAGGFSGAILAVRRFPPEHRMLELLPWCFGLATIVLLPLAWFEAPHITAWGAGADWSLAYIGGFAGPVGTWCVMEAASTLPAMVSSVGFLATPAAGLLISAWWLGEAIGPDLIAGTALVLAGVAVAAWPQGGGPPRRR